MYFGQAGVPVLTLQILYGNLAPEGSVAKITGKEGLQFRGPARVFDSEEDTLAVVAEDPQQLKVRFASTSTSSFQTYFAGLACAFDFEEYRRWRGPAAQVQLQLIWFSGYSFT